MATRISVVITVYNEADNIEALVSALKTQTRLPDEVIIVDAGSSDSTYSKLTRLAGIWKILKVFQKPGNRSVGRNYAVKMSSGNILAFTDAGCIPEPTWLDELTRPFVSSSVQVVSGYYRGKTHGVFQLCLVPFVLVMPERAGKTEFFPSTRSMAIRRITWNLTSGFNENLIYSEDYSFAFDLKKLGISFVFAPKAIVNWIPRKNLSQSAWMFFNFAVGDVRARIFRPKVKLLIIRYFLGLFLLFLSFEMNFVFYILLPLVFGYIIWSIIKNYRYVRHPLAFLWLPLIQITSDICVLFGTLVGYLSLLFL